MIDLHSHINPNIDHGSASFEESLIMLKEAEQDGFTAVFATPHFAPEAGVGKSRNIVIENINKLNKLAEKNKINVKVYSGEEIYFSNDLTEYITSKKIVTLNNGKYILIELPRVTKPLFLEDVIFKIKSLGIIPIIAHPERYEYIQENIDLVKKLKIQGALFQSNFGSLLEKYGKDARKTLEKLLKNHLIDFMGSDSHGKRAMYKRVPGAMKKLKRILTEKEIQKICFENPNKIINNEDLLL